MKAMKLIAYASAIGAAICLMLMFMDTEVESMEPDIPEPEVVVVEPAEEIVAYDPMLGMNKVENCTITHYCICEKCCGKKPDHPAYGITASGRKAVAGYSVAVDPDVIPLGADVFVEVAPGSYQLYHADDTGSAVKGNHIDICCASHEEALQAGVKTLNVYWEE